MKKIIFILICVTILASCDKIQPIKENVTSEKSTSEVNNNEEINENSKNEGVNLNQEIGLKEEELIVKRFELLANNYQNHTDLMKSIQYEQFVNYVYETFNKYKEISVEESEFRNNYIFNILIPKIVINNYVINGKASEEEAELIIQSIKRNDLNTLEDKNLITEKFKIYFEENKFNPFVKNLNTKDFTLQEKLDLLLEDKNGAIYSILSNRYNWNKTGIGFKPGDMEADFMNYLNKKLQNTFGIIGITEEELITEVYKKYNTDSLEGLAKNILVDFNNLVKNYSLKGNIPLERTLRSDEINDIFVDRETVNKFIDRLSDGDSENFIADLEKMRFKMYLLSYFGRNRTDLNKDQGLWSSRARSDFIDSTYGEGVQNLFRLSRYLPGEEIEIKLDNIPNL